MLASLRLWLALGSLFDAVLSDRFSLFSGLRLPPLRLLRLPALVPDSPRRSLTRDTRMCAKASPPAGCPKSRKSMDKYHILYLQ